MAVRPGPGGATVSEGILGARSPGPRDVRDGSRSSGFGIGATGPADELAASSSTVPHRREVQLWSQPPGGLILSAPNGSLVLPSSPLRYRPLMSRSRPVAVGRGTRFDRRPLLARPHSTVATGGLVPPTSFAPVGARHQYLGSSRHDKRFRARTSSRFGERGRRVAWRMSVRGRGRERCGRQRLRRAEKEGGLR
jgi:hypothetical protein